MAKAVKNRKAVTCTAVKKNGQQCKQTRGLVDGFCASHRVAKPAGGVEEFQNILEDVLNGPAKVSEGMKLEFIKGQWVEVPVDVAAEVLKKSEELAEEEGNAIVVIDGLLTFEEAAAVLKQYEPILTYVPESAVKDIREFAGLVLDVVKMPYDKLIQEYMAVTAQLNDLEITYKHTREDAMREYGAIPFDIRLDLEKMHEEIMQLKGWKALLHGTIEFTEAMAADTKQEPVADVIDDKQPSKLKAFFRNLMDKGSKWMIAIGALLLLLAVIFAGEKHFDEQAPKKDTPPVVFEETPKDDVTVPVIVDDVPVDNADKSVPPAINNSAAVGSHVVQDGDTLWDIAEAEYGDGSMWIHIYDANADILNGDDVRNVDDPGHWIHAGQDLHIPSEDEIALNDH